MGAGIGPTGVMQLQRTAGNAAVRDLLSTTAGAPAVVQRENGSGADAKGWATGLVRDLHGIQTEVARTRTHLRADASAAVTAYQSAQRTFADFDSKYRTAFRAFESGVEAAKAAEKAIEEGVTAAIGLVMFAFTGPFGLAATRAGKVVEALDKAKGFVDAAGNVATVATGARAAATGRAGTPSDSKPPPSTPSEVDWNDLVSMVLRTFQEDIQRSSTIDAIDGAVEANLRFLNDVRAGAGPADPQSTETGASAASMAADADKIRSQLRAVRYESIAAPAETFAEGAAERLSAKTHLQLQQEITIRWIAGLSGADLEQIDDADAYLKRIKLIDVSGSRFNFDTGIVTTDVDEKLIQFLAMSEATAMGLVGSSATWLGSWVRLPEPRYFTRRLPGGRQVCVEGPPVYGRIRDNRNREWRAYAPPGTSQEGGGSVRLESFNVELRDARSGWTSYGRTTVDSIFNEIVFMVKPTTPTGGGAPPAVAIISAL